MHLPPYALPVALVGTGVAALAFALFYPTKKPANVTARSAMPVASSAPVSIPVFPMQPLLQNTAIRNAALLQSNTSWSADNVSGTNDGARNFLTSVRRRAMRRRGL